MIHSIVVVAPPKPEAETPQSKSTKKGGKK